MHGRFGARGGTYKWTAGFAVSKPAAPLSVAAGVAVSRRHFRCFMAEGNMLSEPASSAMDCLRVGLLIGFLFSGVP